MSDDTTAPAAPAPKTTRTRRTSKATAVPKFDPLLGVLVNPDTGEPVETKKRLRPPRIFPHELRIDFRSVYDKQLDMIIDKDRVVSRDADGYVVGNAGKKSRDFRPRAVYRRRTYWRVVETGVRIEGMLNFGKGSDGKDIYSGWSRTLPVGTILECIGWRRYRKDGLVAPQFHFDGLPREAEWSQVWPLESVFQPWPLKGILEKIMPDEYESLGIVP